MGCQGLSCSLMCCLLVIAHFQVTLQLVIKKVDIPATVKVGEEYVILDCDYDLENTSSGGLVVKWYLNNFDLVYQWIYGTAPQAIDPASKYIDLNYKASDDPNTMYRAMKLTRPNIDLTGNYTCLISTFEDETSAKRPLTVYSTGREDEFKLWHTKANFDGVEVTCQALGVYPKPTLDITVEGNPDIRSPRPTITETKNGFYNIVSYLTIEDNNIPDSMVINCILGIPKVNYTATKKIVYYPPETTTSSVSLGILEQHRQINKKVNQLSEGIGSGNEIRTTSLIMLMSITVFILLGY